MANGTPTGSIFDEAGKSGKKNKLTPSAPELTADELKARLNEAIIKHAAIKKNLELVYQTLKVTPKEIEKLVSNPDNLEKKHRQLLAANEAKLKKLLEKPTKADKKTEAKERKKKTVGKRRRWISM